MSNVVIFPSVLGVRAGVTDAAEVLRGAGHEVLVVDLLEGRTFDDYAEANAHWEQLGHEEFMRRGLEAVDGLLDGFVVAGFSNGAGIAEHVALNRPVGGVVMFAGALPLYMLGADAWPHGVPAQIHSMIDDPFRDDDWIEAVARSVREAGGMAQVFDYTGSAHLFTDPSLPAEFDEEATRLMWERVLPFVVAASPSGPRVIDVRTRSSENA